MENKGKLTNWKIKELAEEILNRMNALDTTDEEFSNPELLKDFIDLSNKKGKVCGLCEKNTGEKVEMFVGGFIDFAHESCIKIGLKSIDLTEKHKEFFNKLQDTLNKRRGRTNGI